MDLYNVITHRHSERKYLDKKVSEEQIKKIIDAGLTAPSGGNTQPWHFTVIQDKSVQKEIVEICKEKFLLSNVVWRKNWANMENFNPFYNPDVLIIISNNSEVDMSNEDCCFAIQNMVLMAEGLGLSSCIIRDICWAINKENQARFGIPEQYDCFMSVSIGYAASKNNKDKKLDYSKVNYIN